MSSERRNYYPEESEQTAERNRDLLRKKISQLEEARSCFNLLPKEMRQRVIDKSFAELGVQMPVPELPKEEEEGQLKEMEDEDGRIRLMGTLLFEIRTNVDSEDENRLRPGKDTDYALEYYRKLIDSIWSNRFVPEAEYKYFHQDEFDKERLKAEALKNQIIELQQKIEQIEEALKKSKKPHEKRTLSDELYNLKNAMIGLDNQYLPYRLGEALTKSPLKTQRRERAKTEVAAVLAEYMSPEEYSMAATEAISHRHHKKIILEYRKNPGQPVNDRFWGEIKPETIEEWQKHFQKINQAVDDWYQKHKDDRPALDLEDLKSKE